MEHTEKRELSEQEKEATENNARGFYWKRFKEKKALDNKIFVIECAIERGEINPDELIENTVLLDAYPINIYKLHFKTKAGSEYIVILENSEELLGLPDSEPCRAIYISVEKKNETKDGRDPKISQTIVSIILDHLQRFHNDVVYYICSAEDAQHTAFFHIPYQQLFCETLHNFARA